MENTKTLTEIRNEVVDSIAKTIDSILPKIAEKAFSHGVECAVAKLNPALEELQQMDDVRARECSEAYEQGLHDGYERVLGLLKARGITVEL